VELFRDDELPEDHRPTMAYVSMTLPGVVRGPHEHKNQSDLFCFIGPGDFKLFLWDSRRDSPSYKCRQVVVVGESNRQSVIVPPGVVHAYKNVGAMPGVVFNAPNRLYAGWGRSEPVDEIRHEDDLDGIYKID
jgi:dTDP-4-dehydrorhamnose 3,5-epimerase